jgi:hypothetical protein
VVLILVLLAQSMVRHRFCEGRRIQSLRLRPQSPSDHSSIEQVLVEAPNDAAHRRANNRASRTFFEGAGILRT